ncbi:MAG TPA: metabolite traffic protein EboE [Planctomycetota bacterium]|nr:metabolite traffic protein EboE [Planctomycetota bacterium]
MRIPGANAHLTYCLNVHPGGTLAEAETAIFEHAPRVFGEFSRLTGVRGPYGLGAWLPAHAVAELWDKADPVKSGRKLGKLAHRMQDAGLYMFTLNGFPYGRFHGTRVKESVYQPAWGEPERSGYTLQLAMTLARLLPGGVRGSISTLPVTFKPWAEEARIGQAVRSLALIAWVGLRHLPAMFGGDVVLALEPEPGCYLEGTDDVVRFFSERLLPQGSEVLGRELGTPAAKAEEAIRRHIGVCLDTVHTGVMGEDPKEALRKYAAAGIRVAKVQLGAALRVQVGPDDPPPALRAFQDEVYLHQTVVRTPDGRELYFTDLPEPLGMDPPPQGEWRVHFHVPLAWPGEGPIGTTAGQVDEAFLAAALAAGCEHFETEIYTLDVFPAARDSREAILAQDMAWVWKRFQTRVAHKIGGAQ